MSRRAKVIFILLLTLLLAIPVGDVMLAWRPRNPLQFHASHYAQGQRLFGGVELHVDVENTCSTPIYLESALFEVRDPLAIRDYEAHMHPSTQGRNFHSLATGMVISPHQTRRLIAVGEARVQQAIGRMPTHIVYSWKSAPKQQAQDAATWVMRHLPESLPEKMRTISFAPSEDAAILTPIPPNEIRVFPPTLPGL